MNRALIITAFMENDIDIKKISNEKDFIICIDGGYDIALEKEIRPNIVMGDFDSIKNELPKDIEIKRFQPEKDYTDLDLALKTAVEKKFSEAMIFGGIGGRLDHTIANIQLLKHYNNFFKTLVMMDGKNKCFIMDSKKVSKFVLPKEKESYFSLLSLSEKTTGVTIENAKYPLKDHTLTNTFPLGVSNEFAKEKNTVISINDGVLLVIISKMS